MQNAITAAIGASWQTSVVLAEAIQLQGKTNRHPAS